MILELSYDLWIVENQLEIISSRLQYTAIGWIWECLACPNIYSFTFFNACQVAGGLANVHGHTLSIATYIGDTATHEIRNTVFKFGKKNRLITDLKLIFWEVTACLYNCNIWFLNELFSNLNYIFLHVMRRFFFISQSLYFTSNAFLE